MTWGKPLGLDELMIVNPSPSESAAYFLGQDNRLYQVQGLADADQSASKQYFLGDDGTLYQVQGLENTAELSASEQYFLGEDGTFYQIQGCSTQSSQNVR